MVACLSILADFVALKDVARFFALRFEALTAEADEEEVLVDEAVLEEGGHVVAFAKRNAANCTLARVPDFEQLAAACRGRFQGGYRPPVAAQFRLVSLEPLALLR